MRFPLLLICAALLATQLTAAEITITDPWARATAPSAETGAIFAVIGNSGPTADELTAASVAPGIAAQVEVHAHSKDANGVMHMAPVASVTIPAAGKLELKPGSFHLMLFGLVKPLVEGQQIPVTLTFARAGRIEAHAVVGGIAASGSPACVEDCCAPAKK